MCNCKQETAEVAQEITGETTRDVSREITREDVLTFNRFSRKTLAKLPTAWQIETWTLDDPSERLIRHYLQQGRLVIESLAADNLRVEEAAALYSLLKQTDLILAPLGAQASGIGTCTAEKDKCKAGCKSKFCGCTWNSFLCKLNCFFKIVVEL